MARHNSITKLAITGETRLTLESMKRILDLDNYEILYVFGLPEEDLRHKVNSVSLTEFCEEWGITLDKTGDWNNCFQFCTTNNIDMIITLGDSRIVPKDVVRNFDVIGNHGAVLPDVQGGASLVWGRILNSGEWGVSVMKIAERIDGGDILKVKTFKYDESTTEEQFTDAADALTVDALVEVLQGDYAVQENKKWKVRVAKHTDSHKAVELLRYCKENNLPVYMPPRTLEDGYLDPSWPPQFIKSFKIANDHPYPKWSEE